MLILLITSVAFSSQGDLVIDVREPDFWKFPPRNWQPHIGVLLKTYQKRNGAYIYRVRTAAEYHPVESWPQIFKPDSRLLKKYNRFPQNISKSPEPTYLVKIIDDIVYDSEGKSLFTLPADVDLDNYQNLRGYIRMKTNQWNVFVVPNEELFLRRSSSHRAIDSLTTNRKSTKRLNLLTHYLGH